MKILMVDDEIDTIEAMKCFVNWDMLGHEVVGTCVNGKEALSLIGQIEVDIIITDIRMPEMDGLELIRAVKRLERSVEFIVLSGFDEFNLAKEAMKEGVKHYLLKPCSRDEVLDAVKKAVADLEQARAQTHALEREWVLRKSLFRSFVVLLLGNRVQKDEYEKLFSELLRKEDEIYLLHRPPDQSQHLEFWLQELEQEVISHYPMTSPLIVINNVVVFFLIAKRDSLPVAPNSDGRTVNSVMISSKAFHVSRLSTDYMTDLKTVCGDFSSYVLLEDGRPHTVVLEKDSDAKAVQELTGILSQALCVNRDSAREIIGRAMLRTDRNNLLVASTKLLLHKTQLKQSLFPQLEELHEIQDSAEMADFLAERFSALGHCGNEQDNIEKVLRYIDNHLDESDLSLHRLSRNVVFLNENYLGKIFAKRLGEPYSTYLNRKRMERAQQLLRRGTVKHIYLAAEKVGLGHNPRYFSKLFKQYAGCTPKEYLKQFQ